MSDRDVENVPGWWSRLFGRGAQAQVAEQQAQSAPEQIEIRQQLEALRAALDTSAVGAHSDSEALHEALLGLEKQIGRAGREQLKANSIAEAQAAQFAEALEQLRAADTRREAELKALCEQSRSARAAARLELAQDLLPALDGLDEALRAAQPLLEAARQHTADQAPADEADEQPELGGWLSWLLGGPPPTAPPQPDALRQVAELEAGLVSWLRGLTFVRQRLLGVLAAEGIQPIVATGQPFDPNYHLAMGVAATTEEYTAGTVVEELRRGYLAGERVLRHAEVIVAADEERQPEEFYEGEQA